jgi:hypothetical protein
VVLGNTMNAFEHYMKVRELISRLEHEGLSAEAQDLRSVLEGGATGTEIFMGLRFHLSKIVEVKGLAAETRRLAQELSDRLGEGIR